MLKLNYQSDELEIVHQVSSPLGDELAFFAVDGLEEAIEALDPVLGHQAGVELQNVVLEEILVDLRIQIWGIKVPLLVQKTTLKRYNYASAIQYY